MNADWWILHFTVNKKLYYGRLQLADIGGMTRWTLMVFDENQQPTPDRKIIEHFAKHFFK